MLSLPATLRSTVEWVVYEIQQGRKVEVLRVKNLQTTYGLTAFAGAIQPSVSNFVSPQYFVIENLSGAIQNVGGIGAGATSVQLDKRVDLSGDTSLVLGVGTTNQETVTWTAVSGAGPYTYTIGATTKTHAQNDPCIRGVTLADSMAGVQNEQQYDSANFPNQRMQATGGYSPSSGQWTMQFYFTGSQALGPSQANLLFTNVGLADSPTIGLGNLHNHVALGYTHALNSDVEIDVTFTVVNN